MDLIGIDNEAEFFPSGTLSDVLKEELQDITARWAGLAVAPARQGHGELR